MRGAHYVLGPDVASSLLLVADDLSVLMSHGKIREKVLTVLTFLRVIGFPLSWKKLAGGTEVVLKRSSLGLSESRAQWLEGWYTGLLRDGSVQMQQFQECVGRAAFFCGALDYDRPFLAPL